MLASHGWYGVAFDDHDLRGTFVVGRPDVVEPQLLEIKKPVLEVVGESITEAQRGVRHWWHRITIRDQGNGTEAAASEEAGAPKGMIDETAKPGGTGSVNSMSSEAVASGETSVSMEMGDDDVRLETPVHDLPDDSEQKLTFGQRFVAFYDRLIIPVEERGVVEETVEEPHKGEPLLFAYLPDPVPLFDVNSQPQLPQNMIPVTRLYVSETVDPETRKAMQALRDAGMGIKILSADSVERTLSTANELRSGDEDLGVLSGEVLMEMDAQTFNRAVKEYAIFGQLSPSQKADVLRALRARRGNSLACWGTILAMCLECARQT